MSTLQVPLTLVSGWATAHGINLMDLSPRQSDPLSGAVFEILGTKPGGKFIQRSSAKFQMNWPDLQVKPDAPFQLTEKTEWKLLRGGKGGAANFSGRLIGGCIDCLMNLAGTPFADVPRFVKSSEEGVIVYLENAELNSFQLARALYSFRFNRWFEGVSGVILGRNAAQEPQQPSDFSYLDALKDVLGILDCPVLYDADIGHLPPQMILINGARAEVNFEAGQAEIAQTLN